MSTAKSRTATAKPCRILVVDDHSIVRHGITLLLAKHKDLAVCGEAATYEEALEQADRLRPDLMLVDLTLKDRNGLDLIRELRDRHPSIKTLVLSMHDETQYADKALRAGAQGYVMKEDADDTVVEAIRATQRGEMYVSPTMSARVLRSIVEGASEKSGVSGVAGLTERELEIFRCLGEGMSTKKIAEKFDLSARTVEVHRANIKKKLGCEDAAQLLREAVRWVESNK